VKHPAVRIAFTPDEETGMGIRRLDTASFGADFAYTVDGGALGELEYECFNAASVTVTVKGRSIHPGDAKNRMVNAGALAMQFHALLPESETPEHTEGYEGFIHLTGVEGDVSGAQLNYIVRDHDRILFERKKALCAKAAEFLNARHGEGTFTVEILDSYRNMREKVEPHMHLVETAMQAMRDLGVEPAVRPVRGGTDGAQLSWMGLPCPNLCTGGCNFHGVLEYIPVQSMEKCAEILVRVLELSADRKK